MAEINDRMGMGMDAARQEIAISRKLDGGTN